MSTDYIIKQGDHLSGVAEEFGFIDYRTIWNDPANADLKKRRKNPHVLFPGDRLVVPDKVVKKESRSTDQRHKFLLRKTPLKLRLILTDFDGLPLAHADCELRIEEKIYNLKTDANGRIEQEIPRSAKAGIFRVAEFGIEMPLRIGHLDPVDERTGWLGRLSNLGYNPGDSDEEQLRWALEEFQCDYELPVTGILDNATKAKIEKVHGC